VQGEHPDGVGRGVPFQYYTTTLRYFERGCRGSPTYTLTGVGRGVPYKITHTLCVFKRGAGVFP